MLIAPRVPPGANGVTHAYTTAGAPLRLINPLNFRLDSHCLGHTNLSC